jgi:hypothetical protein
LSPPKRFLCVVKSCPNGSPCCHPSTFIDFCHNTSLNLSHSPTWSYPPRVPFTTHFLACKGKLLKPKPHLNFVCVWCKL